MSNFDNLVVVTENDFYICYVDTENKTENNIYLPYIIVNKQFNAIEAQVDTLSQAYVFMYQMNDLLVRNKWKQMVGISPDEEESAQLHLFEVPKPDTKH